MKKIILPILVLGMLFAMPSMAAEYYVDCENGSDANDCSVVSPCQNMNYVMSAFMNSGDTLNIQGTCAVITGISESLSGTADQYTTVQQWEGETQATFTYAEDQPTIVISGSYVTIKGFHITTNASTTGSDNPGISLTGTGSNIQLLDNTIYDVGQQGIVVYGGDNIEIKGNTIYEVGQVSSDNAGIDVTGTNIYLEKNIIYNNATAIDLRGDSTAGVEFKNNIIYNHDNASFILSGNASDVNIYNNSFLVNSTNPIFYVGGGYTGDVIELKNNIFYHNASEGQLYEFQSNIDNFTSNYNLFYTPNFPYDTIFSNQGTYYTLSEWQALGQDANSIEGDPLFTSTTSGSEDFHLLEGSPAIDAGATLDCVPADYDGDGRTDLAHDIGADEYISTLTAPNKPKFKKVTKKKGIVLKKKGAKVDYFKARIVTKKKGKLKFKIKRFTKKKKAFTKKQKKKLKLDKKYTCKVKACNDAGCSGWRSKNFKVKK